MERLGGRACGFRHPLRRPSRGRAQQHVDAVFAAARAVYKGILRYINGKPAVVQPLPVQQLAIDPKGLLRWEAQIDSIEPTAAPTYYMVYVRENVGEWNIQQVEKKTQLPSEAWLRIISFRSNEERGSRPVIGSSRIQFFGSCIRQPQIVIF